MISCQADWVQGSALLLRREVYEDIGGLDEGFTMYSEELDYCRRAKSAGWHVTYHGGAHITHHGGKSSEQVGALKQIHFQSSKLRYFRKHHGYGHYLILRAFLLLQFSWQLCLESAKGALGHKRNLRARARPHLLAGAPQWFESEAVKIGLITGEFPPMPGGVGDFSRGLAARLMRKRARSHNPEPRRIVQRRPRR